MDAPGATEAEESIHKDDLEQHTSSTQSSTSDDDTDTHVEGDRPARSEVDDDDGQDDNEEEEEEGYTDDEEPRFKYANLTKKLGPVFRKGDAASSVLTAGDKMVRTLFETLR